MFRTDRKCTKLLLATLAPLTFASSAWASMPSSFIYQGHLADSNGNSVTATVSFKFQVLAPNGCLLYEEQQNGLDLSTTQGHFTLAVGSPLASTKRTGNDPALGMKQIFANPATQLRAPAATCASGYTPAAGDIRKLRVIVIDGNGEDPLTPDQVIHSVPFATTAETLQGKQPGDFIQNTVGSMQTILEQIANGTSSLYLRTDGANATHVSMNNQRMTSLADPTSAQDAATKNYCDTKLAGQNVVTAGLTQGSFLVWNTGTSRWEPGNLTSAGAQSHALATHPACAGGQASRWDGSVWSCITAGGGGGGGGATNNVNPHEVVTLTNGSTKVHQSNFTNGGAYVLPPANGGMTAGGPIFTFFNKNTNLPIPILNADLKFIGGVNPNAISNVYLFDTSTSGGSWTTDNTTVSSGVEKIVIDSAGPVNITGYSWVALTPTKLLIVYHLPAGGSTYDAYARAVDVDTVNKSATWGTAILLDSGIAGGYAELRALSSSLAVVEYNSSSVKKTLSVSGTTVTQSSGLSFTCNGNRAKLETDKLICMQPSSGSVDVSIHTFTPTSVTTIAGNTVGFGSSHPSLGQATMLNGRLIIPYHRGDAPAGLYVAAVNTADWTNQHLLLDSTFSMLGAPGPSLSSYVPVDTSNTWFVPYQYMGYGNLKKAYKINWDGSSLSSPTFTNIDGVQVFETSGTYYIEQTMGMPSTRQMVTSVSSLTLAAPVRTYYGHPRYAADRNVTLTTSPANSNKFALHFEVGF